MISKTRWALSIGTTACVGVVSCGEDYTAVDLESPMGAESPSSLPGTSGEKPGAPGAGNVRGDGGASGASTPPNDGRPDVDLDDATQPDGNVAGQGSGSGGTSAQEPAEDGSEPVVPVSSVVGLEQRPPSTAYLGMPSRAQLTLPGYDVEPVFTNLTFINATFIAEAPDTGYFFVSEREGRVWAFEKLVGVTEKTLVLDLSGQCQGRGDHGLLGFAFHPEFSDPSSPNRGYVYIHYPYNNPAIVDGPVEATVPTYSRLSRFTVDLDTMQADLSSELVLMDQFDENTLHLGGALFFHPQDGYLYLTVGDEGLPCLTSGNCNVINNDLFSGVLRIDVNEVPDADSHAIVRQPATGVTAHYTIPNDNPFVGQDVLEEFYAIGLRSPHRMTHDAVDDITWIGDVGANTREELNVLRRGANYQWDAYEGFFRRHSPPANVVGTWTDPVIDFTRSDFRTIIGGYVYRGSRFPELYGRYIYGDFFANSIWAISYTDNGQATTVDENVRLATNVGGRGTTLTSFGVDLDGELYVTSLGGDRIKTLIFREQGASNLPETLSATGAFADTAALTPNTALVPYSVQSPLWTDGAQKRRWIALPEGTQVGFTESGPWQFPPGTVFVKHFDMQMDERDPTSTRRLETRLLVAAADGTYYGASYKWNAEQTEAFLLYESEIEQLDVVEAGGSVRQQGYFYPGPRDCSTCHNSSAGYVLGVRTAQLNGDMRYDSTGLDANQLHTWSQIGMFDTALAVEDIRRYTRLAAIGDASRSDEDRVRSYWDSNCSMCHGVVQGMRAAWDARLSTPLAGQGVIGGAAVNTDGGFLIVPGDPDASLLFQRDSTTDPNRRMPPIGRSRNDAQYVEVLHRWIGSLRPAP